MNSAQFGCGAEAPPWCNTDTGSDAGRVFIFLIFFKGKHYSTLTVVFHLFDLTHLFFRQIIGGELFLPVWTNKNTSGSPVFFHSTLFSWSFCFSLRKKSCFRALFKLQVIPLNQSRNKKKKLWHFNGVLLEALQFSMLSYSNSCHLLWANNSISNLLTHLESVRYEIWIFPPVL